MFSNYFSETFIKVKNRICEMTHPIFQKNYSQSKNQQKMINILVVSYIAAISFTVNMTNQKILATFFIHSCWDKKIKIKSQVEKNICKQTADLWYRHFLHRSLHRIEPKMSILGLDVYHLNILVLLVCLKNWQ